MKCHVIKLHFILMQPQTLSIIQKVWDFRKTTQTPLCFTLDAGANVHLLYPKHTREKVAAFIEAELADFLSKSTIPH